jgi:predicted DNA-binding transcriptional regulator AlpA
MGTSTDETWLDVPQFAELAHTTLKGIYAINFSGEGPPRYKVGKRVLYKRSEVLAWMESRRVEPAQAS